VGVFIFLAHDMKKDALRRLLYHLETLSPISVVISFFNDPRNIINILGFYPPGQALTFISAQYTLNKDPFTLFAKHMSDGIAASLPLYSG